MIFLRSYNKTTVTYHHCRFTSIFPLYPLIAKGSCRSIFVLRQQAFNRLIFCNYYIKILCPIQRETPHRTYNVIQLLRAPTDDHRCSHDVLFFNQLLYCATKNPGKAIHGFNACLIDILVALLVHLNRTKRHSGTLCKFMLCASVSLPNPYFLSSQSIAFMTSMPS